MKSVSAWRGSLVDQVLSQEMIGANCYDVEELVCRARLLWAKQLKFGREHRARETGMTQTKGGDSFAAFYDVEYGDGVSEAVAEQAWQEIEGAIRNLFEMKSLLMDLRRASRVIAQRPLTFDFGENQVRAVPDVIAFYHNEPPLIVDWKVHAFATKDYRLQLALYALALLQVKPHRDFPRQLKAWQISQVRLVEVQLLKGCVRSYTLDETDIEELQDALAVGITHIKLASRGKTGKDLELSWCEPTRYAEQCENCSFQRPCWKDMEQERNEQIDSEEQS